MIELIQFGEGIEEQVVPDLYTAGNKGLQLCALSSAKHKKIKVPKGIIIPSHYQTVWTDKSFREETMYQVRKELADMGLDKKLVSVRSGSVVSMPGMMDTVLNVGIGYDTLAYWSKKLSVALAKDCFGRFLKAYNEVVLQCEPWTDDNYNFQKKEDLNLLNDWAIKTGMPLDQDLVLEECISAVFRSWDNPQAIQYRKVNGIPDKYGTAVIIQEMVYGNRNKQSCTGVLFTRDPSDGTPVMTGDFLVKAQGEDIVSGSCTPVSIHEMREDKNFKRIYEDLWEVSKYLETYYQDMQDIEFTVQSGELFILQTRSGKRSAAAKFRILHDMLTEGLMLENMAFKRVAVEDYYEAKQTKVWMKDNVPAFGIGIPGSPGAVTGVIARTLDEVKSVVTSGKKCVFVTKETDTKDFEAMHLSSGVITQVGGYTSHAAVVARGMNKPCILDFEVVDFANGDITMNGTTGEVWYEAAEKITNTASPYVNAVLYKMFQGVVDQYDGEDILYPVGISPNGVTGALHDVGKFYYVMNRSMNPNWEEDLVDRLMHLSDGQQLILDFRDYTRFNCKSDAGVRIFFEGGYDTSFIREVISVLYPYDHLGSQVVLLGFPSDIGNSSFSEIFGVDSLDYVFDVNTSSGLYLMGPGLRDKIGDAYSGISDVLMKQDKVLVTGVSGVDPQSIIEKYKQKYGEENAEGN